MAVTDQTDHTEGQPAEEPCDERFFPMHLEVRVEPRHENDVGRADLPALGVEQPLPEGVPVDVEGEVHPVVQGDQRPRLRLRGRERAAVGLAGE